MALGMSVSEMLARLSKDELTEWLAFFFLEPWGCAEEDHRFGVIAAKIHNSNTTGAPLEPADFFPPRSKRERNKLLQEKIRNTFESMPHE